MEQVNLSMVLEQVAKEKGIDKSVLVETLEQAILAAARKTFGPQLELEARYNPETGAVDLFQILEVIPPDEVPEPGRYVTLDEIREVGLEAEVGDELLFQIFYRPEDKQQAEEQDRKYGKILGSDRTRRSFGRIASQTAKQVIIQRVREAERELIYNEYKDRKGELITGIVRRFERGNIIVDVGRAEAILPVKEQVPRETYRAGDRIVAYVVDIDRNARGPQIILSRTHRGLLEKLFEAEVPEIYEGIVRIESSAREPGSRSKIAVSSRDRDVDPVGACVGMRGSRVQAVVAELHGEKIDIVPYDEDPARFVCNAIAPAEVLRVLIDAESHTMELVVPDDKLSLAIGKKGQNVRLASQLTGWRIDIHSESKVREMEERARQSMQRIQGMTPELAETLFRLGWRSAQEIAEAAPEDLDGVPGLGGLDAATRLVEAAKAAVEEMAREEEARKAQCVEEFLEVPGMTEDVARALVGAGIETPEDLDATTDTDRIARITGLDIPAVRELKHHVAAYVAQKRVMEESAALDEDMLGDIPDVDIEAPSAEAPGADEEASVERDGDSASSGLTMFAEGEEHR